MYDVLGFRRTAQSIASTLVHVVGVLEELRQILNVKRHTVVVVFTTDVAAERRNVRALVLGCPVTEVIERRVAAIAVPLQKEVSRLEGPEEAVERRGGSADAVGSQMLEVRRDG